ncbi:hypothetical protein KUCAC02_022230 [Chaenocephalus aceratus]|nr:hypothetical protein KUCAC02_022230 [Chaenocephalus aceratus]
MTLTICDTSLSPALSGGHVTSFWRSCDLFIPLVLY